MNQIYKLKTFLVTRYELILVPLIAALILHFLNTIGTRFPHQDLMWNDLALLNKYYFIKEALITNLLAAIDFTQGFGFDVASDVKISFNPFDLVSYLLFYLEPVEVASIRYVILLMYCFFGIYFYSRTFGRNLNASIIILFSLSYIASPIYLSDNSHELGGMYLALPMLMYGAKKYVSTNRKKGALIVLFAIGILCGVSDLNIILLYPAIVIWMFFSERKLNIERRRLFIATHVLIYLIIILSFSEYFLNLLSSDQLIINNDLSFSGYFDYIKIFIKPFFISSVLPTFPNPVGLFISPIITGFFFYLAIFYKYKFNKDQLAAIFYCTFFMLSMGLISVSDALKYHTPSYIRYPFGCIPLLIILSTIAMLTQNNLINLVKEKLLNLKSEIYLKCILAIVSFSLLVQIRYFNEPNFIVSILILSFWLFIHPFSFYLLLKINHFKGRFFLVILAVCLPFMASYLFYFVVPPGRFIIIDRDFSKYYLNELPLCIENLSNHNGGSFVPVAKSPFGSDPGPNSGRNDGILSLVELPNLYKGRTFFQWRHSYPVITSNIYSIYSDSRPSHKAVNFFPPSVNNVKDLEKFFELTKSDFLYSADLPIRNDNFKFIGSCSYNSSSRITQDVRISNLFKDQLLTKVFLYQFVKKNDPIRITYTKTTAKVENVNRILIPMVKLPILYSSKINITTNNGSQLPFLKSSDGFLVLNEIQPDVSYLIISSKSNTRFIPLFFLILILLFPLKRCN